MLVSVIIQNGLLLADIQNTSFYTAAEQLFAVQLGWEEVYSFLCTNNDDYFVTPLYFQPSSNAAVTYDANRSFVWTMDTTNATIFPDHFYRLRLIQYQGQYSQNSYSPASKMTIENFGNTVNTPAYRFAGKYLEVYDPSNYSNWCLWYYPGPATLQLTDDLVYPYNMIPEILAYRVAIEARRKQRAETDSLQERYVSILGSMKDQMSRDDSHGESPKDQFAQGFSPYI